MCLLKKSLYDLKQTPRQWYKCFDSLMVENKFSKSQYDSCVYYQQLKNWNYIYFFFFIDDMFLICKDVEEINRLKLLLNSKEMKDLRSAKEILRMEIKRDRS